MGRKSEHSGVSAAGKDRIKFDFEFEGQRYRPTIKRAPTEGNMARAQKQLEGIRQRIRDGKFSFAEEFPDYRFIEKVRTVGPRTCNEVFDQFLKHCDSRVAKKDLAFSTAYGYRGIIDDVWRPAVGERDFESVCYSDMLSVLDGRTHWTKKTYNNASSAIRCAFEFGYRDLPEKKNPAERLGTLKVTTKDRPPVDPFAAAEAEAVIAAIHQDWGEAQGNYDEFRFFTGLRPSEQLALLVSDCDLVKRKIKITKAWVMSRAKDRTKTNVDRVVDLCPRAYEVLLGHLVLRERLMAMGVIHHDKLFFKEDGTEIINLQFGYERWKKSVVHTAKVRYRDPYNARHTNVTRNLMLNENLLWNAKQHGHSVQVMLANYAAWVEAECLESELLALRAAKEGRPPELIQQVEKARAAADSVPSDPQELAVGWQYNREAYRNLRKRRRKWSKPLRAFDPYTLSRGAPSTTRPTLRRSQTRRRARILAAV